MRALGFAETVRAGPGQAGRGHDHDRTLSGQHLELAALGRACLVDVAREDELGTGGSQLLEHTAAPGERSLAGSPWRVRELMVEADDA